MFDSLTDIFHDAEKWIETISSNPWFLLFIFAVALLDSIIPIVPSEFSVIAGGVAAADAVLIDDRPVFALVCVIILGAVGAYFGDTIAYWIGNRSDKLLRNWFFKGEKGEQRLLATSKQIRKRGGLLLITARFIPGGRTAMTFTCGLTGQPFLKWFTRWDIAATTIWASYAALIGYFVSSVIENQATALLLAFGLALSITVVIEAVRWMLERKRSQAQPAVVES